jgi:FkbM family methyltransferase
MAWSPKIVSRLWYDIHLLRKSDRVKELTMVHRAGLEWVKRLVRPIAILLFPKPVYRRRLSRQDLEREIDLLPTLVPRGREAVDVGANIGAYSYALSALASRVHAFEPLPKLAAFISRALPANVVVKNLAVSDTVSVLDLLVPIKEGREDTTAASVMASAAHPDGVHYQVQTTTLNSLSDHDVGFVKIDVEGHEMNVLRGADELIAKHRPTVLIEAEDRHRANAVKDVFTFFAERNYKGFFVLNDELMAAEKFQSSMQDIDRLRTDRPRRECAYVNNFIFIPTERCDDKLIKAMEFALRSKASVFSARRDISASS